MLTSTKKLNRRDFLQLGLLFGAGAAGLGVMGNEQSRSFLNQRLLGDSPRDIPLPDSIPKPKTKAQNILFIVLDTLRADHLSCYGYTRETSPNIDRFAKQGRLYSNVLSPGGYTLPSHASMFTGLPHSAHGAGGFHEYLDDRFRRLPQYLQEQGYQTIGTTCNAFYATSRCGFQHGFDYFFERECQSRATLDLLGRWFNEAYDPTRPYFAFMNFMEPHAPYEPPIHKWSTPQMKHDTPFDEPGLFGCRFLSSEVRNELVALYDDAIHYADFFLGKLFALLESSGQLENTVVVIVSDHGEYFGEKNHVAHDYGLYEPIVRVPMILRGRGFEPGVEDTLVQSHDLFPTLLEIAEIPFDRLPGFNAVSLFENLAPDRLCFSERLQAVPMLTRVIAHQSMMYASADFTPMTTLVRSVQRESWKLIRYGDSQPMLYDLSRDPKEVFDVASDNEAITNMLRCELEDWLNSFPHYRGESLGEYFDPSAGATEQTTRHQIDAARGMGYIH